MREDLEEGSVGIGMDVLYKWEEGAWSAPASIPFEPILG